MTGTPQKIEDRYLVPGLVKGVEMLKAFTPERPVLKLADLAHHLGTTRSAAFRTAYTLTQLGCLLHDEANHAFTLGPGVLRLSYGYFATREVIEVAQASLLRLSEQTGWAAHLGVLDGTSVLYVLRFTAPGAPPSIVHVGSRLPARNTTMGRVLLAGLDEDALSRLYRTERNPGTGTGFASLLKQWKSDRDSASITHAGDFEADIASIAAPLRDADGRVAAAISLTSPLAKSKADEFSGPITDAVVKTAAQISAQLGYQGPA